MGRKKIVRNSEEKIQFLKEQRKRNTRNQQNRRLKLQLKKKKKNAKTVRQRVRTCRAKNRNILNENVKNHREHYLGPMNVKCCHCGAKHFADEIVSNKRNSFNDCCSHGTIPLISFEDFPDELYDLFIRQHKYSNEFLNNIRSYNTSLSFASFNAHLTNFNGRRPGPYCFKVKGNIYYQINTSLYPEPTKGASYGQLFILDPSEANEERIQNICTLNPKIIRKLDKMIREKNIFAKSYQMMKEEVERLQKQSIKSCKPMPEVKMCFIPKQGINARRYNPQISNEVAAIFTTTADGSIPDNYVTIRNQCTNKLEYVSSMDPKVEPWIYPLFFPTGKLGWYSDMCRLNSSKRITRAAYVKNLIAIRKTFNPMLCGGKLFQQWVVDNYIKIEKDRIEYCRSHQKELRCDNYKAVIDHMEKKAQTVNGKVGKMIILPSTFIGSPRNMAQNYQDAMAIVAKHGKPDLFITMTCNPNWKEIRENLLPGQQPSDRSEIVTRVFDLKKKLYYV